MNELTRRGALLGGAGIALSAGTWLWLRERGLTEDRLPIERVPPRRPAPLAGPPFDPRATTTLRALYDELLPGSPEPGLPSASDAGVLGYVAAAAALPGLRPLRDEVLKLARYLDKASPDPSRRFADLDAAERTQILFAASRDDNPVGRFVPARALEVALRLGLEGYLGHPHHGGNRDFVSWDALDIRMPRKRVPEAMGGGSR